MKNAVFLIMTLTIVLSCREKKPRQAPAIALASYSSCAPVTSDSAWYESDKKAPLFEGLGEHTMKVTCKNNVVQRYFDQGLNLSYAFNHAEAARSFYYASKLDPECAMCHWGFAYVLGPNYNGGMNPGHYETAFDAIQSALAISKESMTKKERDLIVAMSARYMKEPPEDRSELDMAYAEAMKKVHNKYPDDADIAAIYAESLMDLHPWDLYDKEGSPRSWTLEILSLLEDLLERNPNHPGVNHFYIHAVESSANPEQGLASASRFDEGLVPNAGHLVHMSSHIYINTGDYHKGSIANIKAIKRDSTYTTACHAQGVYPIAYFPHNIHFLAATATMEGDSEWALAAVDNIANRVNTPLMAEPGWESLQHYFAIKYNVYVKFAKWDDILAMENKVPHLDYPTAIWHYARGMAFLHRGNTDKAKKELEVLSGIATNEELKELTVWEINSLYDLVQIAHKVLRATIDHHEGNHENSIDLLKEAIAIEDSLNYNEPPDWFFSVRHRLGTVQLDADLYEDAVKTYLDDLEKHPKNGWAYKGLTLAYDGLEQDQKSKEASAHFESAWAHADVELETSVMIK